MSERLSTQKFPYVVDEEPGIRFWCGCGRSKLQPYCDGSHKGTGVAPVRVELETRGKIAWCACRLSKTMPFCDGSHKSMK